MNESDEIQKPGVEALGLESQAIWEANAEFWDETIGEGNQFQQLLIGPATDHLLGIQPGERVLDVACGNGNYARRMAELGAEVVACDFSPTLIAKAQMRSLGFGERIAYHVIDATDEGALAALGAADFDAAVCTMGLMDMVAIQPLARALTRLLKPGGRFVFSVSHPCFNSGGICKLVEEEDRGGDLVTTYSVKVNRYLGLPAEKGVGIVGQPEAHYTFHRTISELYGVFFASGFVLDGMAEPAFDGNGEPSRPFSWANFRWISPVLVGRMRFIGDRGTVISGQWTVGSDE